MYNNVHKSELKFFKLSTFFVLQILVKASDLWIVLNVSTVVDFKPKNRHFLAVDKAEMTIEGVDKKW